jgi:hypothetical protein
MPGGTSTQRPEVAKKGQLRYINGDVKKGLEYYNGTEWLTIGTLPDDYVLYGQPSLYLDFANTKSLVDKVSNKNLITFSRDSTATFTNFDGKIGTVSANEPRFDHNPETGESLGLLVEEQRTNLLQRSEEFDNAYWTKNSGVTVTANQITAPDGTLTADLITDAVTGEAGFYGVFTGSENTTYTYSVFVKAGTATQLRLRDLDDGSNPGHHVVFNFSTLAFSDFSNITSGNYGYITYPDGWYRIWMSFTTANYSGLSFTLRTAESGSKTFYAWGAQVEAGAFATSYIPTTSSTVTRSADNASITGSNFSRWFNNTE